VRVARPSRVIVTVARGLLLAAAAGVAHGASLPDSDVLTRQLGRPPATVQVVEPHLGSAGRPVRVEYLGHPAPAVLDALFGAQWRDGDRDVELRALDGYVSRIPAARFTRYAAWLVFARANGAAFVVDNAGQNQQRVPLGPYYLVWDNIAAPELVAEGGSYWPYQVTQVVLSTAPAEALLPGGMAPRYEAHAALAKKHCLTCHRVNGYGGDKFPIDLAVRVKAMSAETFRQWMLEPARVKPGTTMPALAAAMPQAARVDLATRLYEYLTTLPARP